jgi:hypothetical protein
MGFRFKKVIEILGLVLITKIIVFSVIEKKQNISDENSKVQEFKAFSSNRHSSFKWIFNNNALQYSVYIIRNSSSIWIEGNGHMS